MGLRGRVTIAGLIPFIVVAGAFALLIFAINQLRDTSSKAEHSATVLATANRLEKLVLDLETGARAYVITGRPVFLQPWREALTELPNQTTTLETLVLDNPAQERRAQRITAKIGEYVDGYSKPLVETVRAKGRFAAAAVVDTGAGKRRVDALRAQFSTFDEVERRLQLTRDEHAADNGRRALLFGLAGLLGSALLILACGAYLVRIVLVPIRRAAVAARALGRGDLTVRIGSVGYGEVGELGQSFDQMAASLQASRDELESQNAELEVQAAELEDQREQLQAANDEREAQQVELEHALTELAEEKQRVDTFYGFSERLVSETSEAGVAGVTLEALCDLLDAHVALLYVHSSGGELRLLASRGLEPDRLEQVIRSGEGLAGRAFSERRVLTSSHGEQGLAVVAFGAETAVREELCVPLVQAERALGVVALGRVAARPFGANEQLLVERLGEQASVALANAIALRTAVEQASINNAVLNSTTDAIAMVDPSRRIVIRNQALLDLGRQVGLLEFDSLDDVTGHIVERAVDPEAYLTAVELTRAHPEQEHTFEFELKDPPRRLRRYVAPVRDADGTPLGQILVLRDITAERQAEQLKSDLVATVSHELRTPLAGILGFAELLATKTVDAATRTRYLSLIHGEAKRLGKLVDDFLDLQRIEAGSFALAVEPVELNVVLREAVEIHGSQDTTHTVAFDGDGVDLVVAADRDRLVQVVGNLLSNAIKYSPEGGEVTVRTATTESSVRVSVSDSGLGIPVTEQSKIFTKFFRVDSSDTRRIGGTGLGLALCREIVEAHGGTVGFNSVEGQGSTFWFELPITSGDRRRSANVLVVEGDAAARTFLAESLADVGYRIEAVASGEEALEEVSRRKPDLICLDVKLGGELDGWDVLAKLKNGTATATIPVVICTGGNGRGQAAALGAADFLSKPFSADLLRSAVRRLLPGGGRSLLVVDDDPTIRTLVAATLRREGWRARQAADGNEALEAVAVERPDLIVLDLLMPQLNGFEVLDRLHADPATADIPVLVLTGHNLSGEERGALARRTVALLEKTSYSAGELRRLVARALGE